MANHGHAHGGRRARVFSRRVGSVCGILSLDHQLPVALKGKFK